MPARTRSRATTATGRITARDARRAKRERSVALTDRAVRRGNRAQIERSVALTASQIERSDALAAAQNDMVRQAAKRKRDHADALAAAQNDMNQQTATHTLDHADALAAWENDMNQQAATRTRAHVDDMAVSENNARIARNIRARCTRDSGRTLEINPLRCGHCGTERIKKYEPPSICCRSGKTVLAQPGHTNEYLNGRPLENLLQNPGTKAHARQINKIFEMTAVGAKAKDAPHSRFVAPNGPGCMRLNGVSYHRVLSASFDCGLTCYLYL
eukprot:SAG31_NODE_7996_length_1544_cov_2.639446_1_plen_272_part_00